MKKTNGCKRKLLLYDLLLLVFLTAFDQLTKYSAVLKLKDQNPVPIIKGVLEFSYLENRGAAFSMLEDRKIFFVAVAVIFLCIIVYVLLRTPDEGSGNPKNTGGISSAASLLPYGGKYGLLHLLLTAIAAGALGNMLDRIRLGYVVDFIYIVLINFPIFNVADMYVTFATAILVIQVLFIYGDDDFNFLFSKSSGKPNGEESCCQNYEENAGN